jgi:Cation transporter/ATPase, N-terminus
MTPGNERAIDGAARSDAPSTDWYRVPAEDAAARLGTEPEFGLTDTEARTRLDRYGPNVVEDRGGRSAWRTLLAQFTGVLTLVRFVAAVLSVFLGDAPLEQALGPRHAHPKTCRLNCAGLSVCDERVNLLGLGEGDEYTRHEELEKSGNPGCDAADGSVSYARGSWPDGKRGLAGR